jgi:hypothetical protein
MMLHIDGSDHQWFQDERWHDLIVILDVGIVGFVAPSIGCVRLLVAV